MNIEYVESLNEDILKNLLHGSAKIISIKSPYNMEITDSITANILSRMDVGYYENAPKIGRIGMAFFESIDNPEKRLDYYSNAKKWNNELKSACFPFLSPINFLQSELDNNWKSGCKLGTFNGNKMFSGLARIFKEGSSAEPHQDVFLRDAPEIYNNLRISEQLAFNIYLQTPENGGELELWDWKASDEEFINYRNADPAISYGMNRSKISQPKIKYKPKKGEILLFNPRNVHAVAPSNGGQRLTISTFIGYINDNEELLLWS